jgi:hypothetical protein
MKKYIFFIRTKWMLTMILLAWSYMGYTQVLNYPRKEVKWIWPDTTNDDVFYGSEDGRFNIPFGTDSKGNLWAIQKCGRSSYDPVLNKVTISDFVNIRNISKTDMSPLASIGDNYGRVAGEQMDALSNLYVSPTDVIYYVDVTPLNGYKVLKFTPKGKLLGKYEFNTNATYVPQMAFGKDNSIYAFSKKVIYKFDTTFNLIKSLPIDPLDYIGVSDPDFQGGTVDSNGDLYVSADGVICKYDKDLNFIWRKKRGNASELFYNKFTNQLWMNINNSIVVYDPVTWTQVGYFPDRLAYVAFDDVGNFFARDFIMYQYTVNDVTGLLSQENIGNESLHVAYPSPNTGQFSVKANAEEISKIELVDVLGHQEVHTSREVSTQLKGVLCMKVYLKNGGVERSHLLVKE